MNILTCGDMRIGTTTNSLFMDGGTYHLSTKALAELIHTDESIIEALENADYEGNSFLLLNLIATALKMKVEFELVS